MSLFCVVAGLLGHAAALEPMGVSDILGGVPPETRRVRTYGGLSRLSSRAREAPTIWGPDGADL